MFAKNGKCLFVLCAFALVAAIGLPKVSRADYMVTLPSGLNSANCNPRPGQGNPGASYTIGYGILVGGTALNVTALGVEDDNAAQDGGFGDGLVSSHVVSIWDSINTTTPIASVTVLSGTASTYNAGFRYENLTTPVTLAAGGTYYIGAWFTDPISSNDTFYNPQPVGGPAPQFTINVADPGSGSTYSVAGSFLTPACPVTPGNPRGGWAGASAIYTPEPATMALLGLGGLGVLLRRKRR
jgi:hypothetical protein